MGIMKQRQGAGAKTKGNKKMIIDLILDRKDGDPYNPKTFYNNIMEYNKVFNNSFEYISKAMNEGTDYDVKKALCKYILDNDYNIEIMKFVLKSKWI